MAQLAAKKVLYLAKKTFRVSSARQVLRVNGGVRMTSHSG